MQQLKPTLDLHIVECLAFLTQEQKESLLLFAQSFAAFAAKPVVAQEGYAFKPEHKSVQDIRQVKQLGKTQ